MCRRDNSGPRNFPGFLNALQEQLEAFSPEQLSRISRQGGLDIHDLIELIVKPQDNSVDFVRPVDDNEVIKYNSLTEQHAKRGIELIHDGKIAFCILAGGSGTRIGGPKALLEIPGSSETLLSYKLRQAENIHDIWIITSPSNSAAVKKYLNDKKLIREGIKIIDQYESIRLNSINSVVLDNESNPCFYPTGHGDVIPALVNSDTLSEFLSKGGQHVVVVNVDNIGASPDERLCGLHDSSSEVGVTCEVVQKLVGDSGGYLCNYQGIAQIVEAFRIPQFLDTNQLRLLNTNSMIFRADLDFNEIKWAWHRVQKIIDNKVVIQYERLLQQLTQEFITQFVRVERDRFKPIKKIEDLTNLSL